MKKDDNGDIKDAELLKNEIARGCEKMSAAGCSAKSCTFDYAGLPDELKPCNISKIKD